MFSSTKCSSAVAIEQQNYQSWANDEKASAMESCLVWWSCSHSEWIHFSLNAPLSLFCSKSGIAYAFYVCVYMWYDVTGENSTMVKLSL